MPALVLIVVITTDAFLKSYAPASTYPVSLVFLILGVGYLFYFFRRDPQGASLWETLTLPNSVPKWNTLVVFGILLMGFFLRFWKLGSLFDGMTYDEAYKGLDAIAIREFGERPIFLDWNGGREALVAYLVALAQSFFDYSNLSVRIVMAIAGSLSLLLYYLFGRTLFNNRIALLSTFLLAVSKWHIIHSRYGVRAGLYPLFELGTLYFGARALTSERSRTGSLVAAAVIGALGFYTYIAYRIFPIVLLALLLEKNVSRHLLKHGKSILAAAIVCLALVAPLAKFYAEHSASLTDRMKRTQVWNQKGKEHESPIKLVLDSAVATFGMFTFRGDAIARHNVNQEPMLSPFSTAFFLLGALLVLSNARKSYGLFLLVYFFATLLPGILSVGAPNVPRNFGCVPVAFLFTSFGIFAAASVVQTHVRFLGKWLAPIILGGTFLTGIMDTMVRFPAILDSLPPKISALWGMDRDQANVAELINQLGENCEAFLAPQFFFHSTIEYLTYSKSQHKLLTLQTDLRKEKAKGKIAVIFLQPHEINPWWLRDDEGKKFYKWWNQVYGLEIRQIRTTIRKTYDSPFTNTSDWRLLKMLHNRYPSGKELKFEHFRVYVVKS